MQYTDQQRRACDRGLELSKAEHERPSIRRVLAAIAEECHQGVPAGSAVIPVMPAPPELMEEYTTEAEQKAFFVGWLMGTGALPEALMAQLHHTEH
jgi:hypothetical protein